MRFAEEPADILARLRELRATDAPTHGGRVLSYVYDSGVAQLDELAASAIRLTQPVNGLDPTAFPSVAVMEREVVGFARGLLGGDSLGGDGLGGDSDIVGNTTTGGTESCLLAVKTARDNWRGEGMPRLLAPISAHAAFHKAAHYFGLALDAVPVRQDGSVPAEALIERMGADVALVVVSAPSYPHAVLDPVSAVAGAALERGIPCHVDACIGGWVLPFWGALPLWDFRVAGVTSMSADLHKFGYAPKGVSVLLHRGRDRHRSQYFASTAWPGYPVVNPTMLGSRSAAALAAGWAITRALGRDGLAELAASTKRSTAAVIALVNSMEGLRVVGTPVGPLMAVATDDTIPPDRRVDPHHWADQLRADGWLLQLQPALEQSDGTTLPPTTHLTITPVTESVLDELGDALVLAADSVRGVPPIQPSDVLAALPDSMGAGLRSGNAAPLDSETAFSILAGIGLVSSDSGGLPDRMAPFLAPIAALPAPLTERLLTEFVARVMEGSLEPGIGQL